MGILSPISKPLMKRIRKDFGQISETQRIALEAGSAKHEEQIFTGRPDWDVVHALPPVQISAEAQAFLDGPVEQLCRMVDDWEIRNSESQDLPEEAWEFMRQNKFFGLVIPKEYGGKGFNALEHAEVVAKIGTHSMAAALTAMVPNSLGPGELLMHYGTKEQKDEILPKLASGELLPCFALTEPFAGSDAAGIRTRGVVYKDEASGKPMIRIDGEKRYITLAPKANIVGLACRLEDPDNLLGKGVNPGITCVMLPRETPGMNIGNRHRPMDIPFQNGPIFLDNVNVSAEQIIGGPAMAGEGWRMLMECLGIGRSISLPNMSLAAGRRASVVAGAYAKTREQFGFPLSDMKALHGHLARIAGHTYMINAARTVMAQRVDDGETPSIGSAILKVHATTGMADIVRATNRLMGGKAIMQGPHNLMGMVHWGVPVAETVEGDNVMTESVVIYGQGLKKGHPQLSKEIAAAEKGDVAEFEKQLKAHVGSMIANKGRAFLYGLTGGGGNGPTNADKASTAHYKRLNRICAAFNFAANVTAAILGGAIQREQTVSRRLGRVYSHVLLASYTLFDYNRNGAAKAEWPVVDWVVKNRLYEAEQELKELIDNYPNRFAAFAMRAVIFPRGQIFEKPSDKLEAEVAKLLTTPGPVRDRLTRNTFIPMDDAHNAMAQAERTLQAIVTVEEPI
ncbi:MAG: acyl-CoA dehydrogenase, partial [Alphaproteobacteria bacterium]|nr:acyl-CoA dehydrogenase [Alphaproteobacteria bacterium]